MITKRIIPCLDVDRGRVVKGVNFVNLRDAGDPVEAACRYYEAGADEITFLDITASSDERATMLHVVSDTANGVFVPLTVGGGIRAVGDIERTLEAGADKVGINTAALQRPQLVTEGSNYFGAQCIVVAIDARAVRSGDAARPSVDHLPRRVHLTDGSRWEVFTHGGRRPTGIDAVQWAQYVAELGAGEILLTSMDRDGTKMGYDNELNRAVSRAVNVPVIASGGVGSPEHIVEAFTQGEADAALAASIFHFGEYTVSQVKQLMREKGLPVRWPTN